jgi:lysophospholipase L1-like esterase
VSIDGGHPNEKGHKKLAELLEPKFNAILTKFKENDII